MLELCEYRRNNLRIRTYVFRYIVENIGFQWHIHVDCPSDPAKLTLSYIQNSVDAPDAFTCYLERSTSQRLYF